MSRRSSETSGETGVALVEAYEVPETDGLAADAGILFHAPENVERQFPQLPAVHEYAELFELIKARR